MENVAQTEKNSLKTVWEKVKRALTNPTFLYILKRVLSSLITLIIIVAIVAVLIRLLPDNKFYSEATYAKLEGRLGTGVAENYKNKQLFIYGILDINGNRVPVIRNVLQYIYYIIPIPKEIPYVWNNTYTEVKKTWTGLIYLGRSINQSEFITTIIADRMGISMRISLISVLLTYLFGFPLGVAMAKKPGGIVDKLGTVFIVLNYAIPALVFYLFIKTWTGDKNGMWGWAGFGYFYDSEDWRTLIIPIFSIFFLSIPGLIIWVRRFMVDELNSDYVKFARSKGLSENRIMYTHVLRNACVPLVRNIPATLLGALIGSYFVEEIWSIPGTGRELIKALQGTPDIPAIQGLTVLYAAIAMLAFLLGDIITVFFDPRIKITER
ncbi:MAG: ABC transporter permease [Acholeplasmatales bacterium]|nr:ABC transporter permease [Acholeplasmatales bacterium]